MPPFTNLIQETTAEPEWTADDKADHDAFAAVIEARDVFFGVVRDRLNQDVVQRFHIDHVECFLQAINDILDDAGIPLDEEEITEVIDQAIEDDLVDDFDE